MADKADDSRTERLKQARRFLEAGRTHIDPGSRVGGPAGKAPGKPPNGAAGDANSEALNTAAVDAGSTSEPTIDQVQADKPDPTRFGDWEKNGRCIDF